MTNSDIRRQIPPRQWMTAATITTALVLASCALDSGVGRPSGSTQPRLAHETYADFLAAVQTTDGHSPFDREHLRVMVALAAGHSRGSHFNGFVQHTRPQVALTAQLPVPDFPPPRARSVLTPSASAQSLAAPEQLRVLPPDPNAGIQLRIEPNFESWRGQIMFAFASDALSKAARGNLAKLVEPARKSVRVDVVGRTDATGDAQRNERLALGRAIAVRDYFVDRGVRREKFFTAAIPCREAEQGCDVRDGQVLRRVDVAVHRTQQAADSAPISLLAHADSQRVMNAVPANLVPVLSTY